MFEPSGKVGKVPMKGRGQYYEIVTSVSLPTISKLMVKTTLQKSIDEGLSRHKGSNPIPTAVVFGRVL